MMLCFLFSALIVALDQFFKQWILRTYEIGHPGAESELIPGVLGLTRLENDGAMLNILSGQQWLLACIAFLAAIGLIMLLLRYNEGFWGTLALASILGGTVGNLLDRIFNDGKVVDMFDILIPALDNFPIFNVADIFITLGFFTFLIHYTVHTIKSEKASAPDAKTRDNEDSLSGEEDELLASADASNREAAHDSLSDIPAAAIASTATATAATIETPPAKVEPISTEDFASTSIDYDSITDTTPEISLTMEALEAELGSLDIDYDVDELLREYGIEDDSSM